MPQSSETQPPKEELEAEKPVLVKRGRGRPPKNRPPIPLETMASPPTKAKTINGQKKLQTKSMKKARKKKDESDEEFYLHPKLIKKHNINEGKIVFDDVVLTQKPAKMKQKDPKPIVIKLSIPKTSSTKVKFFT